jgi:cytidylate kinase
MAANKSSPTVYVPGAYPGRRAALEELIGKYVAQWEMQEKARKAAEDAEGAVIPPCITFSRKIGVGAQEIADRVANILDLHVADREVVEEIANRSGISEKAVAYFDERFPGSINRSFKFLFGEKGFIHSDYARQLISGINAIAATASTVFVGRGAHLILPRERVLAVRCIGSDDYRAKRIAAMLEIDPADAHARLEEIDKEQAAFYKKMFGKDIASPYEFDLVVNLDLLGAPATVADLVVLAFQLKFGQGKTG